MQATPQRSVFYGFGAWVGQMVGGTTCRWWPQDPTTLAKPFDPSKWIETDLSLNPSAVKTGAPIDQLQCDDAPPNGGLTKVGPKFPTGAMISSLWLEQSVYDKLPDDVRPPRVPDGECRDYELTTVWYWANGGSKLANRRFWGFYAEIHDVNGSSALCSLWQPGKSLVKGQLAAGAFWLDLDAVAHPQEQGFTEVSVNGPKQGALFLDSIATGGMVMMSGPKLPRGHGAVEFPTMR